MEPRDPIYDRLLEPEAMGAAWAALISRYEWFLHRSACGNFESIQTTGLEPRKPYYPSYVLSDLELSLFGENGRNIVCVTPLGTQMNLSRPRFCVAVHRDHLPNRLALDFSFPDTWGKAARLKATSPELSDIDIFLAVVREAGSVACYDPVPPASLRVWVKGAPKNCPQEWPQLSDIGDPDEWL